MSPEICREVASGGNIFKTSIEQIWLPLKEAMAVRRRREMLNVGILFRKSNEEILTTELRGRKAWLLWPDAFSFSVQTRHPHAFCVRYPPLPASSSLWSLIPQPLWSLECEIMCFTKCCYCLHTLCDVVGCNKVYGCFHTEQQIMVTPKCVPFGWDELQYKTAK